jgi:hypothetical protein
MSNPYKREGHELCGSHRRTCLFCGEVTPIAISSKHSDVWCACENCVRKCVKIFDANRDQIEEWEE